MYYVILYFTYCFHDCSLVGVSPAEPPTWQRGYVREPARLYPFTCEASIPSQLRLTPAPDMCPQIRGGLPANTKPQSWHEP
jgi:hypothetical protein